MISAVLLLGPTGSGKTPLGDLLQETGLWGSSCHHFDFGQNLRRLHGIGEPPPEFDAGDLEVISQVVEAGTLLEDEHFPIALKILRCFVRSSRVLDRELVVFNGLPRHVGQAEGLAEIIDVKLVALLSCSSEVTLARILRDTGGDRKGRQDDQLEAIRKRIQLFEERTRPLLDYYAAQGAPVETFEVGPLSPAEDVRLEMEQRLAR